MIAGEVRPLAFTILYVVSAVEVKVIAIWAGADGVGTSSDCKRVFR